MTNTSTISSYDSLPENVKLAIVQSFIDNLGYVSFMDAPLHLKDTDEAVMWARERNDISNVLRATLWQLTERKEK